MTFHSSSLAWICCLMPARGSTRPRKGLLAVGAGWAPGLMLPGRFWANDGRAAIASAAIRRKSREGIRGLLCFSWGGLLLYQLRRVAETAARGWEMKKPTEQVLSLFRGLGSTLVESVSGSESAVA